MFHSESVNENLLVILEYLKNLSSKQMAAEILALSADLKYEISPKLAFIAFCPETLHTLVVLTRNENNVLSVAATYPTIHTLHT